MEYPSNKKIRLIFDLLLQVADNPHMR